MFNVNLYDDDATSELSKRTRLGGGHGRAADTVGKRTRSDGREADTVGKRTRLGGGHGRTVGKRTRSGSGHGWEADTVGRSGSGHGREADTVGRRTRSDGREADTVGRRKAARALRTGFTLGSFAACDRFVTGRLRHGETVYVCRARSRVRGRRQYDYVWL